MITAINTLSPRLMHYKTLTLKDPYSRLFTFRFSIVIDMINNKPVELIKIRCFMNHSLKTGDKTVQLLFTDMFSNVTFSSYILSNLQADKC